MRSLVYQFILAMPQPGLRTGEQFCVFTSAAASCKVLPQLHEQVAEACKLCQGDKQRFQNGLHLKSADVAAISCSTQVTPVLERAKR